MLVEAIIVVLSKIEKEGTRKDGSAYKLRTLNISQKDNEIIGAISVREEIFNICEKGSTYRLIGEYRTSPNGNYISWSNAVAVK